MDYTLAYMLHLFGCACRGDIPAFPEDEVDWNAVYDYAAKHLSLSLLFPALNKLYENGYGGIPKTLFVSWKKESLDYALINYVRKKAAINILRQLETESIPYVVLKGESIAWRYPFPYDRLSLDTDILIPEEYEDQTMRFMASLGANIEKRVKRSHHSRCVFPEAGMIEVHINLMDDILYDVVFTNYNEFTYEKLQKGVCPVLDHGHIPCLTGEDEFIFIFNHFAKHFIGTGCNLRNVCDILVLMKSVKNSINWDFILTYMRGLKMDVLLSSIVGLGVTYFGYSQNELPIFEQCPPQLADDIIQSIILSDNKKDEESGKRLSLFTKKQYREQGKKFYISYMIKWKLPIIIKHFFPPVENLKLSISFVRKHPFLLPIGYIANILKCIAQIFDKRMLKKTFYINNDDLMDQTSDERTALLERLNIL